MLKPLDDRLIVRTVSADEAGSDRLGLPDAENEGPRRGVVVAVGAGPSGEETRPGGASADLSEGDEVLYRKYAGQVIKVDGSELLVIRESDVVALVGRDAGVDRDAAAREPNAGQIADERRIVSADVESLRRGVRSDIERLVELAR